MIDKSRVRSEDSTDFSLVLGGPLYQLWLRSGLASPVLGLLQRRVLAFSVVTWVPPLVLCVLAGTVFGGVAVPFSHDIVTHARFLIALPLFILAETLVHQRIKPLVDLLITRDIIPLKERPRFHAAVASALRWRNSVGFEIILILITLTLGHFVWMQGTSLKASSWYGTSTPEGLQLTRAGFWYAWVSMPVFQFIFFRWYYRLFIWTRFLWQLSRIPLRLLPTHPDRAGGIGFLAVCVPAFGPILLAQGVVLAGLIGGKVFFEGGSLVSFKLDMLGIILFQTIIMLGPLCVFLPQLAKARRRAWGEYGTLATRYVEGFDAKWNRGSALKTEELLGSADIQSLADLTHSYDVIREMRLVPFGKEAFIQVIVLTLLPIAPLIVTIIPLDQLITKLLGIPF
jgi:hypothetical protein